MVTDHSEKDNGEWKLCLSYYRKHKKLLAEFEQKTREFAALCQSIIEESQKSNEDKKDNTNTPETTS